MPGPTLSPKDALLLMLAGHGTPGPPQVGPVSRPHPAQSGPQSRTAPFPSNAQGVIHAGPVSVRGELRPTPVVPPAPKSFLGRQAAAIVEGVPDLLDQLDTMANPGAHFARSFMGLIDPDQTAKLNASLPLPADQIRNLIHYAGAGQLDSSYAPQSTPERYLQAAERALPSAAIPVAGEFGAGGSLARGALTGLVGSAGSGVGGQVGSDLSGGNEYASAAGQLIGGILAGGLTHAATSSEMAPAATPTIEESAAPVDTPVVPPEEPAPQSATPVPIPAAAPPVESVQSEPEPAVPLESEAAEPEANTKYVGSINTENLGLNPEETDLLRQTGIEKGYRSLADTRAAGAALTPEDVKAGIGDVSAVVSAGQDQVFDKIQNAFEVAKKYQKGSPEFDKAIADINEIATPHSESAGEVGRAQNALSQGNPDHAALADALSNPETADKAQNLLETYKNDPDATAKIVSDLKNKSLGDYFLSGMYALKMSSPKTPIKVFGENAINLANDVLVSKGLGAVLGQVRNVASLATGGEGVADRITGREMAARLQGAYLGARDALGYWRRLAPDDPIKTSLNTATGEYDPDPTLANKLGYTRVPGTMARAYSLGTPLDRVNRGAVGTNLPVVSYGPRAVSSVDEFFRSTANLSQLYGAATRQSIIDNPSISSDDLAKAVQDKVDNPTGEMLSVAKDYAQRMRFQDTPSAPAQKLQSLLTPREDWNPGQNVGAITGRVLLPFIRTGDSQIRTLLRATPLPLPGGGLFDSLNYNQLKAGGGDRDEALARMGTGSAIALALTAGMANSGITGLGPANSANKQQWLTAGNTPETITLGGEKYPLYKLGPMGEYLSAIATGVERYNENPDDKQYGIHAAKIVLGTAEAVAHNGWLDNLSNLFDVLHNDSPSAGAKAEYFLGHLAEGLVVPTVIADANKAFSDPTARDTRDNPVLGQLQANIPSTPWTYGSSDLPEKRDQLGRAVTTHVGPVNQMLNPWAPEPVDNDPAAKAIHELIDRNPSAPSFVETMPSSIKFPGADKAVKIGGRQYELLNRISGGFTQQIVGKMAQAPNWKDIPDDIKMSVIHDLTKQGHEIAKAALWPQLYSASAPDPTPISPATGLDLVKSFTAGSPTSMRRTPAGNAAVHGASDSDHLRGDGVDFLPTKGVTLTQLLSAARAHFPDATRVAIDDGNHVHVSQPGLNLPYYGKRGTQ